MTQRNNSMHHASLSVVLLSTAAMAGDWVTLFDGTSLDGWRAAENPKAFTVKDETLPADYVSDLRNAQVNDAFVGGITALATAASLGASIYLMSENIE